MNPLESPDSLHLHAAEGWLELGDHLSANAELDEITKGYEDLDIRGGTAASREYLRVTFADVPEDERLRVRRRLEAYCGQDTLGTVWIVRALSVLL
jgi:hypothetical protein